MKQTEKVLDYMKQFGSITPLEAFRDLGIMRLGARIWDIERQGINITHHVEHSINRFGDKTHYTRYSIAGGTQ